MTKNVTQRVIGKLNSNPEGLTSEHPINEAWIKECNSFIDQHLSDELNSSKKLLIPGDDFYQFDKERDSLTVMANKILHWLGVEIEKQELKLDFYDKMEPPGLYTEIDGKKTILINSKYKNDIFATAAILAHELMHFYLLGLKKIKIENELENELLTDLCTIRFGLGLVIINGMKYSTNWFYAAILGIFGLIHHQTKELSFGYFKPDQYVKLLYESSISKRNIQFNDFGGFIHPAARKFLPYTFWKYRKIKNKAEIIVKKEKFIFKDTLFRIFIIFVIASFFLPILYEKMLNQVAVSQNDSAVEILNTGDNPAKAAQMLSEAAEKVSDVGEKVNILKNEGYAHDAAGDTEKAIEAYNQALLISKKNSYDYFIISGEIAELEAKPMITLENFNQAYLLRPEDFEINSRLALFYADIMEDAVKALPYAKRAYEISKSERSKEDLAMLYAMNENYDEALKIFEEILNKEKPYLHYWIGISYGGKDDMLKAREYLQKAVDGGYEVEQEIKDFLNYE